MININKTYTSNNFGLFKIVKYTNCNNITIEFIDTGYSYVTQSSQVNRGRVKDRLVPSVYGVGYIGDGQYKSKVNGHRTAQYTRWANMLERCYGSIPRKKNASYTYCTVCDEWLNFQNFAKWFDDNHIKEMQIDKDIILDGNKEYNPESCTFVTPQLNSEKAHSKNYTFINPTGDMVEIYNLSKFCRENNLSQSAMARVGTGKAGHHKKWRSPQ